MNLSRRSLLSGSASAALAACASATPAAEVDLAFDNVNVVAIQEGRILRDRSVMVTGGGIVAVTSVSEGARFRARQRVAGGGGYVMPALADMHIHLRTDPQTAFNLFTANGVTRVRNMNDADGGFDHVRIRADVASGRLDGPCYMISGPFLDSGSLRTLADVEPMLALYAARGFDYVKIHDNVSQDIYDAVIEGAHERGMRTVGHAQRDKPLAQTLRLQCIEHAEEFLYVSGRPALRDPVQRWDIAQQVAAEGVSVCPTLIIYFAIESYVDDANFASFVTEPNLAYIPRDVRTRWTGAVTNPYRERASREQLRALLPEDKALLNALVSDFQRAGVRVLLGADAFGGVVPGFSVHRELALLVAAGLSPQQALQSGSVNAAAYLGDPSPEIATGAPAEFVLLEGNPLADISNSSRINGVFARGRWRDRTHLDSTLAGVRAAYA
jgi:imidazolonepropionase-like amidohydrolase